jgi:hypothetical protein
LAQLYFDSKILAWVDYLPRWQVLKVGLRTGRDYDYFGVPVAVYEELLAAESKGRFYNQHIRNSFRFREVTRRGAERSQDTGSPNTNSAKGTNE